MRRIFIVSLSLFASAGACESSQNAQDPGATALGAHNEGPALRVPEGGRVEILKWIDADDRPCSVVCESARMRGVAAGNYAVSNTPLYVCAADAKLDGLRPGYNVMPDYADRCSVAWGGKELGMAPYKCLCQP
jgi:hypothetical protein